MSSRLREQTTFAPISAAVTQTTYPKSAPPQKKQKMSITQTYYLAHTARGKLSTEASRGDHDLRLLVGHANLLDSLMLELQDAEREQEAWFNKTVRKADKPQSGRVQWQDTIYEESIELPDASDSESDNESDNEADESDIPAIPLRRLRSPPATRPQYDDDEEEYDDEDMDNDDLALVRTQSHPVEVEPELVHDSEESDDESPPASPPTGALHFSEIQAQGIITRDFGLQKPSSQELPSEALFQQSPSMIAVC